VASGSTQSSRKMSTR